MAKPSLSFRIGAKFEFNAKVRYKFYIKLAQLLENGVQLDTALKQIAFLASRKKGSVLAPLYSHWRSEITNGENFGNCLGRFVPTSEAMLLEAGANTGFLVDALYNTADALEKQTRIKKAIISSSAYPVMLILMLIGAMMLTSNTIIPTFSEVLPIDQWQGSAKAPIAWRKPFAVASEFIRTNGEVMMFGLIGFLVVVSMSLPRWTGSLRTRFDSVVPWSLYKMWQGSAFLLSISAMMAAGVKLDEVSLNRMAKSADPYTRQRINAVKKWIASGENLGEALHKAGYKFPDEDLIDDLRVYATLRGFDKNLVRVTRSWVEELVEQVEVAMKAVNIAVLFMIAIVIGMLITALYSVIQQIQQQ